MAEDKYYSSLSGDEIENRLIGGVLFNADQGLTTSQKARARANIGAGEGSTSFKILGFFATIDDLREYLQTLPEVGDAYGISANPTPVTELLSPDGTQRQFTLTGTPWHIVVVEGETVLVPQTDYVYANGVITFTTAPAAGTDTIRVSWYDKTAPYNVFVWDGITQTWIDNGPLLSSSLIDDNDTLTNKTWSSNKINTEVGSVRTLANAAQSAADAAQTAADGKAPTSHASTATTYGVGDDTNYGHVKLSDTPDANQDVGDGVAATPAAVQSAYDAAIAFEDITSAFTPTSGVKLQALKIGNIVIVRATGQRTGATTAWVLANIPTQYRPSDSIWAGAAYLNEYKTGVCSVSGGQLFIPVLTFSTNWCTVEITWVLGTPSIS